MRKHDTSTYSDSPALKGTTLLEAGESSILMNFRNAQTSLSLSLTIVFVSKCMIWLGYADSTEDREFLSVLTFL